jgi:pyridoxamine 5'-phosphate oxidase family protein
MSFSPAERQYLQTQRIGRLATVDAGGRPQNNPVAYKVNDDGTVDIGGWTMGATRKYRNVGAHPAVALVVDDIVSVDPWTARGLEIRGTAEALAGAEPPLPGMSTDIIRIHPRRIIAWGVDPEVPGMVGRTVGDEGA